MRRVAMRRPKQPPLLDEPNSSSSLRPIDDKPSPLHIPPPGALHHAAPQKSKRWTSKLKTLLKRGKGETTNTATQGKNRSDPETPLRTKPLSTSKDEDVIQFSQNVASFADFGAELYTTPTVASTPTTSSEQSTATTGRSRTLSASIWSPPILPSASSGLNDSPQTHNMKPEPIKHAYTTSHSHRLGASPLQVDVPKSVMERTSTPLTSSTYTTRKTDSSGESQGNSNSIMGGGAHNALGYKARGMTVYQNLFACAPSLVQAAATIWSDGKTYPDPEPPILEDSSVSSTCAEVEVIRQHETSEERRQRVWGSSEKGGAASFQEEQGMELIFFQEDEEDWSEFPWSDHLVQTEKMDKDIFLSFQEMGFNETQKKTKDNHANNGQTKNKLPPTLEAKSPESEQDISSSTFQVIGKNAAFARERAVPPASRNTPSATPLQSTNLEPSSKPSRIPTFPLSRTRHSKAPPDSDISQTFSAEGMITSNMPNAVDRVSSIIKSVPNVFAKLAQTAAGPSSESEILLSRSSSQVTWVSHAEDFLHHDSRPMSEIMVPSTPDRPFDEGSPNGVRSIHAIRNAIFDSIERSESEQKEGEEEDPDGPLDLLGDLYRVEDVPDPELVLLQSQSSLTDSAMGPPLAEIPVRIPSDGEDHPRCTSPEPASVKQSKGNAQHANTRLLDSSPLWYGVEEEDSQNGENLFVDNSPLPVDKYLLPPQLHPQPDTPGERRSLAVPSRSMSCSPSTLAETDDDSIGLNALASPDREVIIQKMTRGLNVRDQLRQPKPHLSSHYVGRDMIMPRLTPSDEDSDSSSENIDHLLLDQSPRVALQGDLDLSSEEGSVSNFSENLRIRSVPSRTYGDIGEIESVVEMPPLDTGLFSCACWDIPPLIDENRQLKLSHQREPRDGLLIDQMRSDGGGDAPSGRQGKTGLGRKMIRLGRTTSNTLRNLWHRSRSRSDK